MNKQNLFRVLGIVFFLIGVVLGMMLFGGAAWADFEAAFYGFDKMGGGRLATVKCPILMTTSEVGKIGAKFTNPNDTQIDFMVRADISNRGVFRSERSMLSLKGNEARDVSWNVTSDDITLKNFIFAQISNYPTKKISFRQGTCGIIVLDFPQFTGKQIFTFVMIIILVGIVGGLILCENSTRTKTGKSQEITRAMSGLGVLVLLGLLFSFLGSWILGILFFAACVLAIGVILGFFLAE
jgi:hypothetical protein